MLTKDFFNKKSSLNYGFFLYFNEMVPIIWNVSKYKFYPPLDFLAEVSFFSRQHCLLYNNNISIQNAQLFYE